MKILFAASECAPFFKTGGLGDVAGALPKTLAKEGVEVAVVMPYFKKMNEAYKEKVEDVLNFEVKVGWRSQYCGIKTLKLGDVRYYFIDNLYYFNRDQLYGYYDDGERFAFFQQAIIEMMERVDFIPDILHVNDYHTAMIPFLLREKYHWIEAYRPIKTVLTIHNLEFQGKFNRSVLSDLFGMSAERYDDGTIEFENCVNFMKAGILYANKITTVSPSYAQEIQTREFGCGLDVILRMENSKLSGIVNGIDMEVNNPATDSHLPHHYSKEDLSGKAENKRLLQEKMHLPQREDVPVIGVVSRLTYQKGFHLVVEELENLLQFDVQFVLLGTGDPRFEAAFSQIGARYPEKCAINIDFNLGLAQLIYAGSDIFLMPSAFEPCGLSQMVAMRYGTLPVVHEIGGLKDTVVPYNPITNEGTGFGFNDFRPFIMMQTLLQAVDLYANHRQYWDQLVQNAMSRDFSWRQSCMVYLQLYNSIL